MGIFIEGWQKFIGIAPSLVAMGLIAVLFFVFIAVAFIIAYRLHDFIAKEK